MPWLKRWAPLVGVAFIGASTLLTYLGYDDIARWVTTIGGLTGTPESSPVTGVEFAAAMAAVGGVILKIVAVIKSPAPAKK